MDNQPMPSPSRGKRRTRQSTRKQLEKRKRNEEVDRQREFLELPCETDIVLDGRTNIKLETANVDLVDQKPVVQTNLDADDNGAHLEPSRAVKIMKHEDEVIAINEEENLLDFDDEQQIEEEVVGKDEAEVNMNETQPIRDSADCKPCIFSSLSEHGAHPNAGQIKSETVELAENSSMFNTRRESPAPDTDSGLAMPEVRKLKLELDEMKQENDKLSQSLKESEEKNKQFSELLEKAGEQSAQQTKTVKELLQQVKLKDDHIRNLEKVVSDSIRKYKETADALVVERLENKHVTKLLEQLSEIKLSEFNAYLREKSDQLIKLEMITEENGRSIRELQRKNAEVAAERNAKLADTDWSNLWDSLKGL